METAQYMGHNQGLGTQDLDPRESGAPAVSRVTAALGRPVGWNKDFLCVSVSSLAAEDDDSMFSKGC